MSEHVKKPQMVKINGDHFATADIKAQVLHRLAEPHNLTF